MKIVSTRTLPLRFESPFRAERSLELKLCTADRPEKLESAFGTANFDEIATLAYCEKTVAMVVNR